MRRLGPGVRLLEDARGEVVEGESSRIGQHLGGKSDSEQDKTREIGETLWSR